MTKQNADCIIRHLEEFGPAYFQLAQLTRISPEVYRQLVPGISQDGLRVNGDVIALEPANGDKLAAAVAQLRTPRHSRARDGWARLEAAQQQFVTVTRELAEIADGQGKGPDRLQTLDIIQQMRNRLDRLELEI